MVNAQVYINLKILSGVRSFERRERLLALAQCDVEHRQLAGRDVFLAGLSSLEDGPRSLARSPQRKPRPGRSSGTSYYEVRFQFPVDATSVTIQNNTSGVTNSNSGFLTGTATQSFNVTVTAPGGNHPPQFTSTPPVAVFHQPERGVLITMTHPNSRW